MFYSRKSPRMPTFDYSTPTAYFITICTWEKKCIFGKPGNLNESGMIVQKSIHEICHPHPFVKVEKDVVMPNHVHLLLLFGKSETSLSAVIGSFKSSVSKQIHQHEPNSPIWQRSFHDHIIRSEKEWQKIWQYIDDNPRKWEEDCFYLS